MRAAESMQVTSKDLTRSPALGQGGLGGPSDDYAMYEEGAAQIADRPANFGCPVGYGECEHERAAVTSQVLVRVRVYHATLL